MYTIKDWVKRVQENQRKHPDNSAILLAELCPTCYGVNPKAPNPELKKCLCDLGVDLRVGTQCQTSHGLEELWLHPGDGKANYAGV